MIEIELDLGSAFGRGLELWKYLHGISQSES